MSELNWSYTYNTFEVSTRYSAKKMSILAPDHGSKLQASNSDPDIATMFAETQAPVAAFALAYARWIASVGTYKGETNRFTNLLSQLSSLTIKQWDIAIQNEFLQGESDYVSILPNGRGPFQTGAYEVRLTEVAALAERLLPYIALAALRTAVQAYYTMLLNARNVQQQKEGIVQNRREELSDARKAMAVQMYKNLGGLMSKFSENPIEIERFYDLELIRSTSATTDDEIIEPIVGTVDAGEFKNVLNGTFTPASLITISNTGTVPLLFYLANAPFLDVMPPSIGITIEPGNTSTHNVLEFGAIFTEFLNVKTITISIAGSYEVMVA